MIALVSEGEGDEAATMVASSGTGVAAMLDADPGDRRLCRWASYRPGLASPEELNMGGYGQAAAALPGAPYSMERSVPRVRVHVAILVGMMMISCCGTCGGSMSRSRRRFDTWLMDMILNWFEK